jgi:hypothetical protein
MEYTFRRVDISIVVVDAGSEEEARDLAETNVDAGSWEFLPGELELISEE